VGVIALLGATTVLVFVLAAAPRDTRGVPEAARTDAILTPPFLFDEPAHAVGSGPRGPEPVDEAPDAAPRLIILEQDGTPAPGVPVSLYDSDWSLVAAGASGRSGVVRFTDRPLTRTGHVWRAVVGDGLRWPRITRVVRRPESALSSSNVLRLPASAQLHVRVSIEGADPLGLTVTVEGDPPVVADVDASGEARFCILPGHYRLLVTRFGVVLAHSEAVAVEGPVHARIELPPLVRARGRVVDAAGRGVSGVALTVLAGGASTRLLSAKGGEFRTPPMPSGEFRFSADVPGVGFGSVSANVVDAAATPVLLTLTQGRRLTVVVRDAHGRSPACFRVNSVDAATSAVTLLAESTAGEVAIRDARPGLRLQIESRGHRSVDLVVSEQDLARGTRPVELARTYAVEGRLVRADGTVVVGYEVSAPGCGGNERSGWVLSDDPGGRFLLPDVPEGSARLSVRVEEVLHTFEVCVAGDSDIGDLRLD